MKSDNLYVEQILDSILKIESFIDGKTKKNFQTNQMAQSAVILQLAIIGEVSKKLGINFKKQHDLPWKEIAGFRDKAIHDYFSMDINVVWDTIKNDIEPLKKALKNS